MTQLRYRGVRRLSLAVAVVLAAVAPIVAHAESLFMAGMASAMSRMDTDMRNAPMTGNPDHDFVSMMVPHHTGAIRMAELELQYGHDQRLRRLAQEIIITQGSEIQVMQAVANEHTWIIAPK